MGNWDSAYDLSAKNEGGISKDSKDTGNYYEVNGVEMFAATRYGQTFENWLTYNKKKKPTTGEEFNDLKEEFEKVSKEDVKASFKAQYWDRYNLDKITDDKVASNVYDAMINQRYTLGGSGSHETLSDVLNSLGYETDANTSFPTNEKAIDALNKAIGEKGGEAVNKAYSDRREKSYMGSKTVDKHGKGWLKRLNEYRNEDEQYSQNELNEMSFTSDSTSNMAVLDEIRNRNLNVDEGTVDKGSDIKNKDNLNYLRRRAQQGSVELSDSDVELVANVAEDQRVKWSKLGVPTISDTILNATGIQRDKIGVDDDATNAIHRAQVVEALSEDLDMNTIGGKKALRQRLKSYAELVKSDGWKEKVDALAGTVRETSYQNMLEDLSFDYRTLIVDANKIHKLEGDEKIDYEDAVRMPDEEGVISDNKSIIQAEIKKGNTGLADRVAKEGLDAVALDLAKVQKDAADSGDLETDAITLLLISKEEQKIAARDKSLSEGVKRGEELALEDDDTEEEEESMESLGLNEDGTSKKPPKDRANKMKGAEAALSGLKAAAGIISLSKALAEPDVETPELSPLIQEAVQKQAQLAKSGLTAQEKNAAMSNLNNAYAGAMKNVLRASGGQRGLYLANQGTVDANRIAGLNQLAAQDAVMHRENIKQYNALATSVGQMKLQRDMSVEQMRQTTLNNNRQILSGVGTNLLSDAISDVGYYLNPNRKATEEMTKKILEGSSYSGENYNNPYMNAPVGTASKTAEELAAEKKAKEEQENTDR